ncbi:MAG: hypothetical protein WCI49_06260 [Ferruginibacter sp.]
MNKAVYFFTFYFLLFFFTSCYTPRYVYSPSAHNAPAFTKKGDSKLAFNYSINAADNTVKDSIPVKAKAGGYDLQAAYAITNHWAIQLNYAHRTERNTGDFNNGYNDSVVINYTRNLTEIGIGFFHALNENKNSFFQVYGGIGFGKSGFTDNGREYNTGYRTRFHNMDVVKVFVQPAFTVRGKRNFAATLSSRHSVIYFKNIRTDYTATELDNFKLDSLSYRPRLFWEPSMVNTFGCKGLPGIQFEFQAGFAFLVSRRFVDARTFNFSAGLLFDLPKIFAISHRSSKN